MPDTTDTSFYPPVSFSFKLAFTGISSAMDIGFQEASGLTMEMGVEEVVSGGGNRFKYRLPDATKFNNLVLKRGLIPIKSGLSKWITETLSPGLATPIKPKMITLSLLDSEGKKLRSWDFINAYPVKWSVSDVKSMENTYAVEHLEFAYNFFKKN